MNNELKILFEVNKVCEEEKVISKDTIVADDFFYYLVPYGYANENSINENEAYFRFLFYNYVQNKMREENAHRFVFQSFVKHRIYKGLEFSYNSRTWKIQGFKNLSVSNEQNPYLPFKVSILSNLGETSGVYPQQISEKMPQISALENRKNVLIEMMPSEVGGILDGKENVLMFLQSCENGNCIYTSFQDRISVEVENLQLIKPFMFFGELKGIAKKFFIYNF